MARWKQPKLNSEVRLKKWPAGRVAQLKLFLGHLEQAVGISLAAQVEQSPKRKFSEFVPKIVPQDISTDIDFREARLFFVPPRGLKNLLFYEFDISATEGFYSIDRFVSPDHSYVFSHLNDGFTYYIRVRVVTKNGEVGPWSDAVSVTTPLAQARGLYDGTEYSRRVKQSTFYPWQTVWERTYSAIGGTGYYQLDYDVSIARKWFVNASTEWSDIEFKWMDKPPGESNYHQVGQNFTLTTYGCAFVTLAEPFYTFSKYTLGFAAPIVVPGDEPFPRRGTFFQKATSLAVGEHSLRLEAKIIPDHSDSLFKNEFVSWIPGSGDPIDGSDAYIKVKNFGIFEVLVEEL